MMTSFRLTKHVARILVNSAEEAYLLTEPKRKTRWKDEVLSHMCEVLGEMLVHPQLVVETCVLPVLRMTVRIRSCLQVILSYLKPFYGKWQSKFLNFQSPFPILLQSQPRIGLHFNESKIAGREAVLLKRVVETQADTLVGGVLRLSWMGWTLCLARE